MTRPLIYNIVRFVVLVGMQVFLFQNMGYYNIATPFPYVLFLLLLPIGISNFFLFLIAFLTGLTVDAFYDTLGVHAAACVALAWVRTIFLRVTLEADNHEKYATPMLGEVALRWFLPYLLTTVLAHHTILYVLEVFSFTQFHYTLLSIGLSCIFTITIILLISLVFYRKKRR